VRREDWKFVLVAVLKIELKIQSPWLNELRIFVVAVLDNHVEKFCHRLERGEARLFRYLD
jgi:hypothetical protein